MHQPPDITFFRCEPYVCLTESDADQLLRYLDKLEVFEQTRERLRREPLPR